MCKVSKPHAEADVLADFSFSAGSFLLLVRRKRPACVLLCMCVCVEYSWVFLLCRGRIIVDLQGLKTMSRHTSGTHSQSVTQWNTINSCLMLPHGHCPLYSEGWGKAGSCETRRHIFTCNPNDSCQLLLLSSSLLTYFLLPALPLHRCVTRLMHLTLTLWWLTSVWAAHLLALPSVATPCSGQIAK